MKIKLKLFVITLSLSVLGIGFFSENELHAQSPRLQNKIDSLRADIEKIRGKKFKHSVKVENQSMADFEKYLERTLRMQFSETLIENYGRIVKKLGLYRGPDITDFLSLAKMVLQSQAAAYYDPDMNTFYMVMQDLPQQMLDAVYVHELYHGFQDQYFNLDEYVMSQQSKKLNDDQLLARQAVVEGEATYIMTLWTMQNLFGMIPEPAALKMAIQAQAQMDVTKLLEMLKSGTVPQSADMKKAVESMDDIPPFMVETLVGAYLKGMAFIFEIEQEGWQKVAELYQSKPPLSSEQILHPQKWLQQEKPFVFDWPAFENGDLFHDWNLLEENVIGELQWRIIFNEHGLTEIARDAAAGWNGDIFAILENKNSAELLLLIHTSWDTVDDAEEFELNYRELLQVKYPDGAENTAIERIDKDVLIIEGGDLGKQSGFLSFMKKINKDYNE